MGCDGACHLKCFSVCTLEPSISRVTPRSICDTHFGTWQFKTLHRAGYVMYDAKRNTRFRAQSSLLASMRTVVRLCGRARAIECAAIAVSARRSDTTRDLSQHDRRLAMRAGAAGQMKVGLSEGLLRSLR